MKTKEVKQWLQRYFDGTSTVEEENALASYFRSGEVADELKEYTEFFTGISELSQLKMEEGIEEEVMDFLLQKEMEERTKHRGMWQLIAGIAASVVIVVGGFLFYYQRGPQLKDTFDDPAVACAYAAQTLEYVSAQYNKGLKPLGNFDRLENAVRPVHEAVRPVNEYLKVIEGFQQE